jgi:Raf kinase inhibitor-like YbhB/YbcL family protein
VDRRTRRRLLAVLCLLVLIGCRSEVSPSSVPPSEATTTRHAGLTLTSPAFEEGAPIPVKYTCDGEDISPPLEWRDPPTSTASFALVVDDPDAGATTWIHWVIYDLPAEVRQLREGVPTEGRLPSGAAQGQNSWPKIGYGGPCPPSGTHRYFFSLYALDTLLGADAGLTQSELLQAMEGHLLAQAQLMGTYARQ